MRRHSLADYPQDWGRISTGAKQSAGWRCIRCDHYHDPEAGYTLTVHHMDMDPSNNRWWNLLALCQRCHLHIQNKINLTQPYMFEHSKWFKPYIAGYYAAQYGLPDDREYVMENLEKLLDIGRPFNNATLPSTTSL